jgi:asparagine synthase (glutamine-hydrolysing)
MCGIVGVVSPTSLDLNRQIEIMRDSLKHRGPDGQGVWCSSDKRVWLAHRRLAILDTTIAGAQPMSTPDGTLVVTFNGEIYNHLELRKELGEAGFSTRTDTEVLLRAYERWGEGCLDRLTGMFAFAIFDTQKRCLFIARDRMGEKPLYFGLHNRTFVFASELKALMAYHALPRDLDLGSLQQYFTLGYIPSDRCILRSFQKLRPAHALRFDMDSGTINIWPYWKLPESRFDEEPFEGLISQLESLLFDSVRRQMIADVPVGVLLSGGIDSSLVAAAAVAGSSASVKTFTVAFPGQGHYDESRHARLVAQHLGTAHTEIEAEENSVDLLPDLAKQYDEPLADSSIIPTFILSRLVRRSVTVALGGDGGDELFGGYHHYQCASLRGAVRDLVPAPVKRIVERAAGYAVPLGIPGRSLVFRWIGSPAPYFDRLACKALLAPLWNRLSSEDGVTDQFDCQGSWIKRAMAQDATSYLPDDVLVKVDRASMLNSLEVRAPLLDYRIVNFAFSRVPDKYKVTWRHRKIILQHLGKRLLPPQFDYNRKQGFSVPLAVWLNGTWRPLVRDILGGADKRIFDVRFLMYLLEEQPRRPSLSHLIFAVLMFELWRRSYEIKI